MTNVKLIQTTLKLFIYLFKYFDRAVRNNSSLACVWVCVNFLQLFTILNKK